MAGHRRFPGAFQTTRLAMLALTVLATVGPMTAMAGTPNRGAGSQGAASSTEAPSSSQGTHKPERPPEPRVQKPDEISGFRVPFKVGTSATVEQGWNTSFSHNGKAAFAYDLAVPLGTPIVAAADGVVSYVHDGETKCGGAELLKKANLIVIDHADGSSTQYGHLSTIGVKEGDVVVAGQEIGTSGDTGYSQCLPHLHFARQFQDGAVTQSVPVYFQGYAGQELHDGDVVTAVSPECAAPLPSGKLPAETLLGAFCGRYASTDPDHPQGFVRKDASLSFDWRTEAPGTYWLNTPGVEFTAQWAGRFDFEASGTYVIHVSSGESVTVSIDGVPVALHTSGDPQLDVAPRYDVAAGVHLIEVEYLSVGGHDQLQLEWHLARAARFDDL